MYDKLVILSPFLIHPKKKREEAKQVFKQFFFTENLFTRERQKRKDNKIIVHKVTLNDS
jgi:hypothetical protein